MKLVVAKANPLVPPAWGDGYETPRYFENGMIVHLPVYADGKLQTLKGVVLTAMGTSARIINDQYDIDEVVGLEDVAVKRKAQAHYENN